MAEPVQVHETHSAFVLFVDDRAFKVKKPVDLGFLDFTTPESRRRACARELELNRRLAPDVYLDVATLSGSDGTPIEYVLVMRRLPDPARLSARALCGVDIDADLRAIARTVAALHAESPTATEFRGGGAAELARRWSDLLTVVTSSPAEPLEPAVVNEVRRLATRFVGGRQQLLDRRAADGHVVDGHGDLQADDIFCLADGPRILDCLDFDDRLRAVDVLDDVAFLMMDLERLRCVPAAEAFRRHYLEFSGTVDHPALLHHYIAYRAFVRAAVAVVRVDEGDPEAIDEARRLADLALDHLRRGEVSLVLVGGAPGTGKSTLARFAAAQLDADIVSTDRVRRELLGDDPSRYTTWAIAQVYDEALRRARDLLLDGRTVVLDATWASARNRDLARRLARETWSRLVEFECQVPPDLLAERVATRTALGADDSEADVDVALEAASRRDAWPEATVVDMGQPVMTAVALVGARLDGRALATAD